MKHPHRPSLFSPPSLLPLLSLTALLSLPALLLASACGNTAPSSGFTPAGATPPGVDASAPPSSGSSGSTPDFGGVDGSTDAPACTNLCLQQKSCSGGATTSLSGSVFDPAGKVPLYNVIVYVPNAPLDPLTSGATCDKCGAVSGSPLVATITDASGHFKLDNVPVGKDIPLVVQVGKWRRQVTLPIDVQPCVDNPLTDPALADLTRLPKNQQEGNIPRIALTTGEADALECFLRKVGIDDSEFTTAGGTGRVQLFQGYNGSARFDAAHGNGAFAPAQSLWSSEQSLAAYDLVLLSCEGGAHPETKPPSALEALQQYVNAGGRVFASHWHRFWLHTAPGESTTPSPFDSVGAWNDADDPPDPSTGVIDTSFPKGQAMRDWLASPAVGASTVPGQLTIRAPKNNIASVDPTKAQSWISIAAPQAVEYLSFNAPQSAPDDQKCGRVVYSDLHVSSGVGDQPSQNWPSGCMEPTLSPQEKALEFMLFDLSSCIQPDTTPPSVPPVR